MYCMDSPIIYTNLSRICTRKDEVEPVFSGKLFRSLSIWKDPTSVLPLFGLHSSIISLPAKMSDGLGIALVSDELDTNVTGEGLVKQA
jgi:hypothetical protein